MDSAGIGAARLGPVTSGVLDLDKPIRDDTETEPHDVHRREPTKVKVNGVNLTEH